MKILIIMLRYTQINTKNNINKRNFVIKYEQRNKNKMLKNQDNVKIYQKLENDNK